MRVRGSSFCVFVKPKTAYEMRISDWSSDVCSSDLFQRAESRPGPQRARLRQAGSPPPPGTTWALNRKAPARASAAAPARPATPPYRVDRKSVVEGKRVSGRVDVGGRRIIKKKNNQERRRYV